MWAKHMNETSILSSPTQWKKYPFQTVKRYLQDDIEEGFLKDAVAPLYRVYLGTPEQALATLAFVDYDSVDALLADGWNVE